MKDEEDVEDDDEYGGYKTHDESDSFIARPRFIITMFILVIICAIFKNL